MGPEFPYEERKTLPLPVSIAVAFFSIPVLGIVGASMARALSMVLSLVLPWHFGRR